MFSKLSVTILIYLDSFCLFVEIINQTQSTYSLPCKHIEE